MTRSDLFQATVNFAMAVIAAVVATLSFAEGELVFGIAWALMTSLWFLAGFLGLRVMQASIALAEVRGEMVAAQRIKARAEEWSG